MLYKNRKWRGHVTKTIYALEFLRNIWTTLLYDPCPKLDTVVAVLAMMLLGSIAQQRPVKMKHCLQLTYKQIITITIIVKYDS